MATATPQFTNSNTTTTADVEIHNHEPAVKRAVRFQEIPIEEDSLSDPESSTGSSSSSSGRLVSDIELFGSDTDELEHDAFDTLKGVEIGHGYGGQMPKAQGLYLPEEEKDSCGVGFIVHQKGKPSHKIVSDAKSLLCNMTHRGATGADSRDGDGAGIMCGMPDDFMRREVDRDLGYVLPAAGEYAIGNIFFNPRDTAKVDLHKDIFTRIADSLGLRVLGWREVPKDNSILGPAALSREPIILQPAVVLKRSYGTGKQPGEGIEEGAQGFDRDYFDRQLYVLRKHATHTITLAEWFYICSLSAQNIVYKGQLSPVQVYNYYHDLNHAKFASHFTLVHSRFSTNTMPSWDRAQPMRWAAHNGEINTVRGNKNWMRAREGNLNSEKFGDELDMLYPIIEAGGSDSAAFDNVLELLVVNNVLTLPEAVMMMVPEAWQDNKDMEPEKVAFYQWAACLMEPWDGPALFAFSDGRYCGANLDRNGLRPCRWITTDDDIMICASEVGTIYVPPEKVTRKGRLQPGKMLLVDTREGRIVDDKELKMTSAKKAPFAEWYNAQMLKLPEIMSRERKLGDDLEIHLDDFSVGSDPKLLAFGYSFEQMDLLMRPMVTDGKEALGSMGNDTALACMTTQARVIYDYFRQLFAQVTNPPIDPIREAIVMSLECYVGAEGNLLEREPKQCRRLLLPSPVLSIEELHALQHLKEVYPTWPSATLDLTFDKKEGVTGYEATIDRVCKEASKAVDDKYRVVILSDRATSADRVPVSAAAACGAVHHYLVRTKQRSKIALIIETGEAREVHHICVLVGYGADGVCPYLIMEAMLKLRREGLLKTEMTNEQIIKNYQHATDNGILKVMSKMGISTLHSYKGAQIFEALGLHKDVIDKCFSGTASRVQGATFELLAMDALELHERGFPSGNVVVPPGLPETGEYHWREGGESHINDPAGIAFLQDAVRTKNQRSYDAYAANARQQVKTVTLRGLLDFDFSNSTPVDIEEVEPWHEIVKRFCTGAMSYGSISMEAHSTLAVAMNRLGGKSNTGEGGEDAERSQILPNGDTQRSSIKQIASGRFGVTSNYLADADELQIKMAQGAKPGEGGELPGHKVSESIGKTRHSTPGVGLISPPPHHDIYSIEDLKQLIYDLKCSNPRSRVSVKLVSEVGVGVVASGVAKARADHILISGHDGGTGAARWTSVKYAGLPWELGLAETHQTLVLNDLRGRVTVQTDGNLRTGRDVAIACLLGAEEWGFATVPLIAMGCIMMRKCHLNTCPVGIATQDPELRAKFAGQPEQVINFFFYLAEELRGIMAKFGFRTINEMVGHAELLKVDEAARTGKTTHLDLSPILKPAWKMRPGAATYKVRQQDHRLYVRLDNKFIDEAENALATGAPVKIECEVVNTDRALATTLSNKVSKKYGEAGLPKDTIHISMRGSAGQSLGAFMAPGITVELEGDANDYVGKGLSGGRLIVYPPRVSNFKSEENIIVGNVCLYGATSGEAYFRGIAAERFAVRNSGAYAVCEGVGDHGCEYMTGGRVVILGGTGRNFAAGMSGGIAYVLDTAGDFDGKCNKESVELEPISDEEEIAAVRSMIENHKHYTGSEIAARVLDDFKTYIPKIIRVMPSDYKAVLEKQAGKAAKEAREGHNGFDIATDGYAPEEDKATVKANGVKETPAAKPGKPEPAVVDLEDSMVDGEKEKKRKAAPLDKTRGFMKYKQLQEPYREISKRTKDWKELTTRLTKDELRVQGARCMDCGVPFCQSASSGGCPLGNLIPRWNDLVFKDQWKAAWEKLAATNNLPEVTGRVCPAPCQNSCVLGINDAPVGIKSIEAAIIDNAWEQGWVVPRPPTTRSGKKVYIIGSGPAGISAADQLNKAGHLVTVFERSDRLGGLMMYGIPNMKLDKELVLQRRINLYKEEGITFVTSAHVGVDPQYSAEKLRSECDALIFSTGATFPRDLRIDGREAKGVHFAMEFLQQNTKSLLDSELKDENFISAKDKHVLVIGGGDTGNDCIATSLRHNARSVTNFELLPQPPNVRAADNPWPQWAKVFRVDYGHAEVTERFGKDPREYSISTKKFTQNAEGHITAVTTIRVEWTKDDKGAWKMAEVEGSEQEFKADLILLALGFLGPETAALKQLGLEQDARSNIKTVNPNLKTKYATATEGVFATGDCRRGQSLIVWAISEGRECAAQVDRYLSGKSGLPMAGSFKLREQVSVKGTIKPQTIAVAA